MGRFSLTSLAAEKQPVDLDEIPDPDAELSEEEKAKIKRKLMWKLDLTILPWLCLLYLLAFLDRANIGNAKIAGLTKDLNLATWQFNASLTIFFVPYSVIEPLTNVLTRRLRPSIFIPAIMLVWGIVMTFMGFVTSWEGLMAARFFLGLAEAGLFPGINYYLSCWYKRTEMGTRSAIFFASAAIAGAFGGLLAAAIEEMEGIGNKPGWAWIFILEGLLTVLAALLSFRFVHDYPAEAAFLTETDRARVLRRLHQDSRGASAAHDEPKWAHLGSSVRDYKMWIGMAIYMGTTVPLYAFSMFLPSIIHDMGWSATVVEAQLFSVPPYAAAALLTVLVGWLADRTRSRGVYNMACSLLAAAGFAMLLGSSDAPVKYAGTFLGAMGIYPCISNTISWTANNVEGVYRRGIILGFVIGWGNLCGIISSNVYFTPPGYKEGHSVMMAFLLAFLLGGSTLLTVLLRLENRRRMAGRRDVWAEGKTERELLEMGDRRPDFIYTT